MRKIRLTVTVISGALLPSCSFSHLIPSFNSNTVPTHSKFTPIHHQLLKLLSSDTTGNGDVTSNTGTLDGGGKTSGGGRSTDGKPVCPRCGEPFTNTFAPMSEFTVDFSVVVVDLHASSKLVATTRFIECSKCKYFFIFMVDGTNQEVSSEEEQEEQESQSQLEPLPSPREVCLHLVSLLADFLFALCWCLPDV